jgi:hypothetical protein
MRMLARMLAGVAILAAAALHAAAETAPPHRPSSGHYALVGDGFAVVFSPDIASPANRYLHEALGFAYFENADWNEVLRQIEEHNRGPRPVRTLIIETHGTNGNGLKLQSGKGRSDARSYIAAGALQERVGPLGVRGIILSACNSGRLLRPEIYLKLDPSNGDPLFLPATRGIVDASDGFDPGVSRVRLYRRSESRLETLVVGRLAELPPSLRDGAGLEPETEFAVSTLVAQLAAADESLRLVDAGYERRKSSADFSRGESEAIFQSFLRHLRTIEDEGRIGLPDAADAQPAAD